MATGRFIFGYVLSAVLYEKLIVFLFSIPRLGGENLAVAQNTYAVMWFKGKELNMVFGLLLSVSRIVSYL